MKKALMLLEYLLGTPIKLSPPALMIEQSKYGKLEILNVRKLLKDIIESFGICSFPHLKDFLQVAVPTN